MPRKQQLWTRKKLHRQRLRKELEAKTDVKVEAAIQRRLGRGSRKVDMMLEDCE